MANVKSDKKTRDALFEEIRRLQRASMSGKPIPTPQRTAMKGQAAALHEQWLELEAARFNNATAAYKKAIQRVESAIAKLHKEIDSLDNAIKVLERATAVIKSVDGLLNLAVKHLPII
jgi:exonuclease VII small subunit